MTISTIRYLGELRLVAQHTRSNIEIETVAPPDNQGKGDSFSPTDLLATSLATCIVTIMGIKARDLGVNLEDTRGEVFKIMAANPRRVAEVKIDFTLPSGISEKDQKSLEAAGRACPVAKSLHPDLIQTINFYWK